MESPIVEVLQVFGILSTVNYGVKIPLYVRDRKRKIEGIRGYTAEEARRNGKIITALPFPLDIGFGLYKVFQIAKIAYANSKQHNHFTEQM